ncbi:AraC family transcriptional regulator [Faunimonas pinastri]|uniref:AraC family transcriptional regulator n=1 Tax=Faunimonas pinastri TaxID=1855383 RepID=UPI001EEB265D|nr:AraC family transcriptional regulator [Faunimonas pinastri]
MRDGPSGVEAIHARFLGHAYDMHHHEEWLVGVTHRGVQDFFCRGRRQRSTAGRVILIEPGEMHDGQAVTPEGFSYSMLYIPQPWLNGGLGLSDNIATRPRGQPGFRATLSDDARLAAAIHRTCALLAGSSERLVRDAALDAVLAGLKRHFGQQDLSVHQASPVIARRARECLQDDMTAEFGADELARRAGAENRFQLARAFRAAYGTSPHAFLVQIRLTQARRLLKAGMRPASVAAACGFSDQSHLGRWFRRAYGLTPAEYRAGCTGVPDFVPAGE